jgi:hypothetical protein
VIPATREAQVGGLLLRLVPGKNLRSYLKNNESKKRLVVWLKWQGACLASTMS